MSFINMPLGDAQAREAVAEGKYDLRIDKVEPKESRDKPGQMNIRVLLKIIDEPTAKSIFHYIAGIGPSDDEETQNNKKLQCIAFLNAFGIEWSEEGFELEDFPGAEASGITLKQEEYEGTIQNKIVVNW